jgi:hypothetical protein
MSDRYMRAKILEGRIEGQIEAATVCREKWINYPNYGSGCDKYIEYLKRRLTDIRKQIATHPKAPGAGERDSAERGAMLCGYEFWPFLRCIRVEGHEGLHRSLTEEETSTASSSPQPVSGEVDAANTKPSGPDVEKFINSWYMVFRGNFTVLEDPKYSEREVVTAILTDFAADVSRLIGEARLAEAEWWDARLSEAIDLLIVQVKAGGYGSGASGVARQMDDRLAALRLTPVSGSGTHTDKS